MPDRSLIRVGTRGSVLARVQTESVIEALRRHYPHVRFEVVTVQTRGDAILDRPLDRVGGKGLFTEELELGIREGRIDFAVHSLKDLPTALTGGLALAAIPPREDARDALVGITIDELRNPRRTVRIGTSSLRRLAQLRRRFPCAEPISIRGNVDTRLRKIREGQYDGGLLALAGLRRLGAESEVRYVFDYDEILPAPAQGALAVETRVDDGPLREILRAIHCPATEAAVTAERTVLARLEGGCQVPVAAFANVHSGTLRLRASVISLDGAEAVEATGEGPIAEAEGIGHQIADEMKRRGADRIVKSITEEQR